MCRILRCALPEKTNRRLPRRSRSKNRRSTYRFRHYYATIRLTEGVDVYLLARQMGTSGKMIEDHCGPVSPAQNAEITVMAH